MGRFVWVVISGLVEDMEFNTLENVFGSYDDAKAYVEKCDAVMAEDGYFYNSSEVYDLRQMKVK